MSSSRACSSKAWKRLTYKCSPTKKIFFSPIRPCEHLIGNDEILNEEIIKAHIWILLNTEEFHYQNAGIIVHHSFKKIYNLCKLLKVKWNYINWESRLTNHSLIAQGGFGQVFRATDKLTGTHYALKRIIPPRKGGFKSVSRFSSNLLQERNIFLELNQSSFFVRILAAFQSIDNTDFWFVLDFCFCDLRKIISLYPYISNFKQLSSDYLDGSAWEKVSEIMTVMWSTKYDDLVFIYLFEMLCALHYLATRHIIHADIKPENFLIANNCHLKLTDFGVSFRNDWFYRNSIINLSATVTDIEADNRQDSVIKNQGTLTYYDPEQHIELLNNPELISELVERLKSSVYYFSISSKYQSFLSDLYGVGLIAIEMITGGLQLTEESIMPHISEEFWNIELIYNDKLRDLIFTDPFSRLPCDRTKGSVFTFLLSIFLPRKIRAKKYRSMSTIFHQKSRDRVPHIDINLVEKIPYYQSESITKESVQNIVFPQYYFDNLVKLSEPMSAIRAATILSNESSERAFNLHPFAL